jgi:hypothetical protein
VSVAAAVRHVLPLQRNASRRARSSQAIANAWNSLTWRHWLIAVAIGVLMGVVNGAFIFLFNLDYLLTRPGSPVVKFLINIVTRWVILMTGVACALAFALALLREISRRGAIRPRDVAVAIIAVAAIGSLVVDPIAVTVNYYQFLWLQMPSKHFLEGVDWLTALSRMYSLSGEKITTFVGTVILSAVYYLKDSRTSGALAVAQLGLSHAQKRRLTEELRSAQAALDPDFLFATLDEVDRRFDTDPLVAQRLLDALIRYLRAALPAKDDSIGTLGQQAALLRAYLEIEGIRSSGRLQADVDIPSDLDARLFAPALILPLVALAAGDVVRSGRDARVQVGVSLASGRLIVEVRCDGCEPWATAGQETKLDALRHRVAALYGSTSELSFATRAPRGSTAMIVIDDPGNA